MYWQDCRHCWRGIPIRARSSCVIIIVVGVVGVVRGKDNMNSGGSCIQISQAYTICDIYYSRVRYTTMDYSTQQLHSTTIYYHNTTHYIILHYYHTKYTTLHTTYLQLQRPLLTPDIQFTRHIGGVVHCIIQRPVPVQEEAVLRRLLHLPGL